MENNESLTVISAWKNFTMLDCVKHIALSYTGIKQTTLNSCWKKLWPNVFKNEHSISTLNEYSQTSRVTRATPRVYPKDPQVRNYRRKILTNQKMKLQTTELHYFKDMRAHALYHHTSESSEEIAQDFTMENSVTMAHSLGGEGFDDFTNGDIAELMADKELSEDDLVKRENENITW
ncbi:hypothetical protein LAZ67_X001222 [Cordylochernes scorpioides]|uniref:Uncharacterized protein n=1 Tax=Cordylochernes scorpioides TaxID=51811 RepID=A0ABY6LS98_9ARAC|nr:hypothetical protein LAZ67_X001222 [Cordylochernes scorpioides]